MADNSKIMESLQFYVIKAIEEGDVVTVEELITSCNDDSFIQVLFDSNNYSSNRSLLHTVVEKGSSIILATLLRYGADVNAMHAEKEGYTLLHHAANKGQLDVARMLIEYKANVNAPDSNEKFPISYAIENNNFEMTKLLVSSGAKIKYPWEIVDGSPNENFWKIIKFLVDNDSGIDINGRDKYGRTALHYIMCDRDDDPRVVDMYEYGKDITDLRRDLAKTLLSRGADVNAQMPCGWSLLLSAVNNNDDEFVEILLKYKANVNITCFNDMRTPLHLAAGYGNYENTRMLIDAGARVDAKDESGESPLHCASESRNEEVVEILLEYGAKIDDTTDQNHTPLDLAATEEFVIVKSLLEACADVENTAKDGQTALHSAVACRRKKNVKELLDYGADINRTGKSAELDGFARKNYRVIEENVEEREALILLNICDNSKSFWATPTLNDIFAVIRQHITKLQSLNMYVDKRFLESSHFVNESEEYRITCEHEVELMKREKIRRSNVSYYDILKKSTDQLASLTRNKRIADILESLSRTKRFPIFRKMLYYHLKKGQHRGNLLRSSLKTFNVLSRYALPESVSFDLLMYLRNRDLVNLIDADPNNDRR